MPGSPAPRKEPPKAPLAADYLDAAELIIEGKTDAARDRLKDIVRKHRKNEWMEPAYVAAEADYARLYNHRSEEEEVAGTLSSWQLEHRIAGCSGANFVRCSRSPRRS